MKKPVFEKDVLSFCEEFGVKSPEELIGRKIYLKFLPQEEGDEQEEIFPNIIISQILLVSLVFCNFLEDKKEDKVVIISISGDVDFVIAYFLIDKKIAILKTDLITEAWYVDALIEEIYVYPNNIR